MMLLGYVTAMTYLRNQKHKTKLVSAIGRPLRTWCAIILYEKFKRCPVTLYCDGTGSISSIPAIPEAQNVRACHVRINEASLPEKFNTEVCNKKIYVLLQENAFAAGCCQSHYMRVDRIMMFLALG